ncbi:hypothetical protein HK101_008726 [Irineochytrium annulatum]|nr:hypothetical protein HK101_008726 [Irineochytrium annulatum]
MEPPPPPAGAPDDGSTVDDEEGSVTAASSASTSAPAAEGDAGTSSSAPVVDALDGGKPKRAKRKAEDREERLQARNARNRLSAQQRRDAARDRMDSLRDANTALANRAAELAGRLERAEQEKRDMQAGLSVLARTIAALQSGNTQLALLPDPFAHPTATNFFGHPPPAPAPYVFTPHDWMLLQPPPHPQQAPTTHTSSPPRDAAALAQDLTTILASAAAVPSRDDALWAHLLTPADAPSTTMSSMAHPPPMGTGELLAQPFGLPTMQQEHGVVPPFRSAPPPSTAPSASSGFGRVGQRPNWVAVPSRRRRRAVSVRAGQIGRGVDNAVGRARLGKKKGLEDRKRGRHSSHLIIASPHNNFPTFCAAKEAVTQRLNSRSLRRAGCYTNDLM